MVNRKTRVTMTPPNEKLAQSREVLLAFGAARAMPARGLTSVYRERLRDAAFLGMW